MGFRPRPRDWRCGTQPPATLTFSGCGMPNRPRAFLIQKRALTKLQLIDPAVEFAFLCIPPGNRLEAIRGNRAGQHCIRINDQWRIYFVWTATEAATRTSTGWPRGTISVGPCPTK